MVNFNLSLDTNIINFEAKGTFYKTSYETVNISIHKINLDVENNNEEIIKKFKHLLKKTIRDYVNEMNIEEKMIGDMNNYITDEKELKKFIFFLNNYTN